MGQGAVPQVDPLEPSSDFIFLFRGCGDAFSSYRVIQGSKLLARLRTAGDNRGETIENDPRLRALNPLGDSSLL